MLKKFAFKVFIGLLPSVVFAKMPIMGKSHCTEHQMRQYLLKKNPKVDSKYLNYAKYFLEEGKKEGVRGDLAFAQSLHETDFFKFGNDVKPNQNNFGGLGAVGNKEPGLSFKTPQEGIRAQIQHLKAYASKKNLNQSCVDPRFNLVQNRGCAPYVEDLSGLWASPGYEPKTYKSLKDAVKHRDTYGHKIKRKYLEMHRLKQKPEGKKLATSLLKHNVRKRHVKQ